MPKKIIGKTFGTVLKEIKNFQDTVPLRVAGVEAVNFFTGSFKNQAWEGVPWKPRKNNKGSEGRAILIKKGTLRRAIRIQEQTPESITVGVKLAEVPYAEVHNSGSTEVVTVRTHRRRNPRGDVRKGRKKVASGISIVQSHTRKNNMPKRQFIGDSQKLNDNIKKKIDKEAAKIGK